MTPPRGRPDEPEERPVPLETDARVLETTVEMAMMAEADHPEPILTAADRSMIAVRRQAFVAMRRRWQTAERSES